MVTHDVDEALYLADRLILMTDGPEAGVGEIMDVPFGRPRRRVDVLAHPQYHACRRHIIEFLEHRAHKVRQSVLDHLLHKELYDRAGRACYNPDTCQRWRTFGLRCSRRA
jgi:ABC-type taurine transport system ATPase subunit